jgi:hypothetical protein
MRLDRIGGSLVIGGWGLVTLTGLIFAMGGSVGIGTNSVGGLVLAGGLGLVAAGAVTIGASGPPLLHGRAARVGLAMFGIGLFSMIGAAVMAGTSAYDPMESIPTIVLLLLGGWTGFVGALVTVLALLRAPGRPRRLGSLLLGGLGSCVVGATLSNTWGTGRLDGVGVALVALGGVAIVLGGIGVGLVALDAGPTEPAEVR